MAVKGSSSEEPVAGKPHGGFCEGCRFLTKIVNIFKEEKDVYSTNVTYHFIVGSTMLSHRRRTT
jgi:hypothetical protein